MAKTNSFSFLIIGAGNIAANYDTPDSPHIQTYAHAIYQNKQATLLGFYDIDTSASKKASNIWGGQAYVSLEATEADKPDVVCVAVPDQAHFEVLLKVVNLKPKLVITEKPLALTTSDAHKIVTVYDSKKIPLMVNYSRRFVPSFIDLAKRIKDKEFGIFQTGSGYYGKGLLHNGSHLVNLIQMLIGEVEAKSVFGTLNDWNHQDPSYSFIVETNAGKQIVATGISRKHYSLFEVDLLFSQGRIRITHGGLQVEEYQLQDDPLNVGFTSLSLTRKYETEGKNIMQYVIKNAVGHLVLQEEILSTDKQAMETLAVCEQIRSI